MKIILSFMHLAQRLLVFRIVRYSVAYIRYFFFRYLLRSLKTYNGSSINLGKDTLNYNLAKIKKSITSHSRVYCMLYPLLAISYIDINKPKLKVLSIGPRSESELLLIASFGFKFSNIKSLDLFSYSPMIDVGDMHEMPYGDNSFDVLFSGWVLAYSDNREKAIKEMVRVLKPGGYITFGQGFSNDYDTKNHVLGGVTRENNIDDIFASIVNNIDVFYFKHDITKEMAASGERAIIAVFKIKK